MRKEHLGWIKSDPDPESGGIERVREMIGIAGS